MSSYIGAGIGQALSRQAERTDLDRRSRENFEREKEKIKYEIEQNELAKRSALAAGGSEYMRNEMDIEGHRRRGDIDVGNDIRRMERESQIKQEAERNGWVIAYNEPGNPDSGVDLNKSGPEVNKLYADIYRMDYEAGINRHDPKTGGAREPRPPAFGSTKTSTPTTPPRSKGGGNRNPPGTTKTTLTPEQKQQAKDLNIPEADYEAAVRGTETPEQKERRRKAQYEREAREDQLMMNNSRQPNTGNPTTQYAPELYQPPPGSSDPYGRTK